MHPRRKALLIVLMLAASSALPSSALPVGPPSVYLQIDPTADPYIYEINVAAHDPDGQILSIEICIEDATPCETASYPPAEEDTGTIVTCLMGDSKQMHISHRFPRRDTYRVVASATAGGCPVIGVPETTEYRSGLVVNEPHADPPPLAPIPCAGQGISGESDPGVFDDRVLLGATVAHPPPARLAYLEGGASAIRAAESVVNSSGGVCGRLLDIEKFDDGGDPAYGAFFIQRLIEEPRFALVAMPSSEGLHGAIDSGLIDNAHMPAIGTTGRTNSEFASPWVWPMGPSNTEFAEIVSRYAYDLGARQFAIVYVNDYRYGIEIAQAAQQEISSLSGASLVAQIAVRSDASSYGNEIAHFNSLCASSCDAVIYALDPATMLTWMWSGPSRAAVIDLLSPHLMNRRFAEVCKRDCDGLVAWTPFHPPIGESSDSARRYERDLAAIDPDADPANPFTQGAYFGTLLTALAIGDTGVDLTRAGLKTVLDSNAFDLGVTAEPLSWAGDRRANRSMRGYELIYAEDRFVGWHDSTGWVSSQS